MQFNCICNFKSRVYRMKENKIILLYERFIELDYEEELDKVPKLKNRGVLLNFWKNGMKLVKNNSNL